MVEKPILTIYIPTYKRPEMLKKAIESCQKQTVENIQIIILDDDSNDETSQIVNKIALEDERVQYICHSENIGMLRNYQFGISHAKNDFFSFLSDDDILLPSFCETALSHFKRHPEIAFSACSTAIITENKKLLGIPLNLWSREGLFSPTESISEMVNNKYPIPTTILFRTSSISKATIDFENQTLWDVDFIIQLAAQFPVAISKKICGIFISHEGSYTNARDFRKPLLRLLDRIEHFSWMEPAIQNLALSQCKIHLKHVIFRFFVSNLIQKRFSAAKQQARELMEETPSLKHLFFLLIAYFFSAFPPLQKLLVLLKKRKEHNQKVIKWLP